jgi:hypothetical protein
VAVDEATAVETIEGAASTMTVLVLERAGSGRKPPLVSDGSRGV